MHCISYDVVVIFLSSLSLLHFAECISLFSFLLRTHTKKQKKNEHTTNRQRIARREREKNQHTHTHIWRAFRSTERAMYVAFFFYKFIQTLVIIFRLFHSMSDKLYTKCKQMNWVHVDFIYCCSAVLYVYIYRSFIILFYSLVIVGAVDVAVAWLAFIRAFSTYNYTVSCRSHFTSLSLSSLCPMNKRNFICQPVRMNMKIEEKKTKLVRIICNSLFAICRDGSFISRRSMCDQHEVEIFGRKKNFQRNSQQCHIDDQQCWVLARNNQNKSKFFTSGWPKLSSS